MERGFFDIDSEVRLGKVERESKRSSIGRRGGGLDGLMDGLMMVVGGC